VPTWAIAILAAVPSGFLGAWFGAWQQTRHDRIERLRDRRIDAADGLLQAWPTALFAIDGAIDERDARVRQAMISQARGQVNDAVRLSVRVDLVFGSTSLTSSITNVVRDEARDALRALEQGDTIAARQHHLEASHVHAYLVIVAGAEIERTGKTRLARRRHKDYKALRELEAVFKPPEIDVDRIEGSRTRPSSRGTGI
jgi:hypothetical protein